MKAETRGMQEERVEEDDPEGTMACPNYLLAGKQAEGIGVTCVDEAAMGTALGPCTQEEAAWYWRRDMDELHPGAMATKIKSDPSTM